MILARLAFLPYLHFSDLPYRYAIIESSKPKPLIGLTLYSEYQKSDSIVLLFPITA